MGKYKYKERKDKAETHSIKEQAISMLLKVFDKVKRGKWVEDETEQRKGVDIILTNGKRIKIDLKAREPSFSFCYNEDIDLEIWSVKEKKKKGWTLDRNKEMNYVLYVWKKNQKDLFPISYLLPFPETRYWLEKNKDRFEHKFSKTPTNGEYTTEHIPVPINILKKEIGGLIKIHL